MRIAIQPCVLHRLRHWMPYGVLAFMLALTVAVTSYVSYTVRAKDRLRFQNGVQDVTGRLRERLDTYVALLQATSGLFAATGEVSRAEFAAFVGGFDLRHRYPGAQAIGYIRRVTASNRAALDREMRDQGFADFRIWPEGSRAVADVVVYIEPIDDGNRAVIGYDPSTDTDRSAAMRQAEDTGVATASGKVTLIQQIDPEKRTGFLVFVPVYRRGQAVSTGSERQSAVQGFVYSPIRADDLLEGIFDVEREGTIDLAVYDGGSPGAAGRLHDSLHGQAAGFAPRPRFTMQTTLAVAGRRWTLVFTTGSGFERSPERALVPMVALGGILTSMALFAVTLLEFRARNAAERVAADLRAAEADREHLLASEREAHRQAQAANAAKDEFLATLSHELRTPLNAILGWTRMARAGQLDEGRQAHALEVVERNAGALAGLVEDLLDVSRIIVGKLRVNARSVDLVAVVQAAIDAARPATEAKGVTLGSSLRAAGTVMGDADRLQQVVGNLLSNAIKFTPAGGRVDVGLTRVGATLELEVRDTGVGISAAFLPHVFERFRQADSTSTRLQGGMGLGLAIVRHLVELMGGTVRAKSAGEGGGASFVVALPAEEGHGAAALHAETLAPVEALIAAARSMVPDALAGVRVLVVDDDADSRELVATTLEQVSAQVVEAGSTDEALAALAGSHIDLIISDISKPDADGFALIRAVRAHETERVRRMPAVALTARAGTGGRDKILEAGFQMALGKPVEIVQLQSAVAWLTGRV